MITCDKCGSSDNVHRAFPVSVQVLARNGDPVFGESLERSVDLCSSCRIALSRLLSEFLCDGATEHQATVFPRSLDIVGRHAECRTGS